MGTHPGGPETWSLALSDTGYGIESRDHFVCVGADVQWRGGHQPDHLVDIGLELQRNGVAFALGEFDERSMR
jgi:hypothetical protein